MQKKTTKQPKIKSKSYIVLKFCHGHIYLDCLLISTLSLLQSCRLSALEPFSSLNLLNLISQYCDKFVKDILKLAIDT